MWLKRVEGGRSELVEGVGQTEIRKPFEVDAATGARLLKDGTGRWEKATAAEAKAAAKRAEKAEDEEPQASGDGSSPPPAGEDAAPEAAPDHSDPAFGHEED